ncbi:hypothetical protein C7999DRAFT_13190 [Corynascus novoguineensis]|uniref:P68 RBP/TagC-like beta-propeller domain-containing protein n=1 Tax=Corynascus novoguineensis TaxID=1126955 RepID=A0AAN7CVA0_9PEZI|nr:hypothetical protein C7999DRAFT_13190 [Corynascus novoguineensis]
MVSFSFTGLMGLVASAVVSAAAVPSSPRFDLSKPSYDLFRSKPLHDDTVQQGFAFDNVNRRLFVAQRKNGADDTSGDLAITQLDFSGKELGHMYLKGFGHGVAFGAQADGSATYLWTEVDANTKGYGKQLARFKFTNGKTLTNSSSGIKKFKPVAAATEHTCTIDPVYNRLVVRYHLPDSGKHIAVYDLAKATKGDFSSPLANFKQPLPKTKGKNFQGYAAYGKYLYLLWGDSYDVSSTLNSEVASVDMNTGKLVQGPLITKAGSTLSFREPEGLAIYKTAAGQVRLFLGFASGKSGDRRSNLFYKNATV